MLLGIIAAVAFATILAVVAGLTITASASFAHDIYGQVIKRGEGGADAEVRVARIAAVVIGVVAIIGGIFANGQNIAFLVALAFAIAASANLPTILYSLFWKRFNTRGALWSIYGGLISAIVLIVFSPTVSGGKVTAGKAASMITDPSIDFHWFPLANPGPHLHPAGVLPRLARHGHLEGAQRGEVRRDGGPLPHRRRCREGGPAPLAVSVMRHGVGAPDLRVRGVRRVNRNGRLCVICVSRKEDAMTPRQPHSPRRYPPTPRWSSRSSPWSGPSG